MNSGGLRLFISMLSYALGNGRYNVFVTMTSLDAACRTNTGITFKLVCAHTQLQIDPFRILEILQYLPKQSFDIDQFESLPNDISIWTSQT